MMGGGPVGLAVAQRVAEDGFSGCAIDPVPRAPVAMGLSHCLDTGCPSAVVFIGDGPPKVAQRHPGVHAGAAQAPGICIRSVEEDEHCVIPMDGLQQVLQFYSPVFVPRFFFSILNLKL
jgi:hypothetical protein